MKSYSELTHFAGFDWAKDHHDIVVVDSQGAIVLDLRIEHTTAGWQEWRERIAAFPALGVAIETSFGSAVEQLLDSGVSVYPVNYYAIVGMTRSPAGGRQGTRLGNEAG